jgi:hypothetical protein
MSDYSMFGRQRRGIALVSVLYFLVVCALTSAAVLFAQRVTTRNTLTSVSGAQLLAAADEATHAALGAWNREDRARQMVGSTTIIPTDAVGGIARSAYITRLTPRVFSIVGEARLGLGAARRVSLLVRLPMEAPNVAGALVSAVGVSVSRDVRFVVDTACGDTSGVAIALAPDAPLTVDADIPPGAQPIARRDPAADDSVSYLRVGNIWWSELARLADIRLTGDTRIAPAPSVAGAQCVPTETNWGDPRAPASPCGSRAPLVYVAGDLTIDGGAGQGVLLVDGRLAITGAFMYSGQIVATRGIETRADNIAISGVVYAWRARVDATATRQTTNDVMLTHATTLRRSRCDAAYGVASWFEPRRVRDRAWTELF